MGDDELNLAEEGLVGGGEVRLFIKKAEVLHSVPRSGGSVFEIAVGFGAFFHHEIVTQKAGVAGVPEPRSDGLVGGLQRDVAIAPMVLGIGDILMHSHHHSGAIGRADRVGAVGFLVENAFLGHLVEVGCLDSRHAVALEVETHVLGHDPNDVGFGLCQAAEEDCTESGDGVPFHFSRE